MKYVVMVSNGYESHPTKFIEYWRKGKLWENTKSGETSVSCPGRCFGQPTSVWVAIMVALLDDGAVATVGDSGLFHHPNVPKRKYLRGKFTYPSAYEAEVNEVKWVLGQESSYTQKCGCHRECYPMNAIWAHGCSGNMWATRMVAECEKCGEVYEWVEEHPFDALFPGE